MTASASLRAMVLCTVACCTPLHGARAQEYAIRRLDPPSTNFANFSRATAINDSGVVIGDGSAMFTTDIICIWTPGEAVPRQHYFSGFNRTTAEGINDRGNLVGYGPASGGIHGFFNSVDLGLGKARGINNKDQVVGYTHDSLYIYQAGVFDYLPTSSWGSEAVAINDSGVAAGYWYTDCAADCYSQACLFRNDSLILIGTLGGNYAEATDINNRGQLAGWSCLDIDCNETRGFIWTEGTWTTIPTLGGFGSQALAINDEGIAVGESYTAGGAQRAVIFDAANGLRDLNDLIPPGSGWELLSASDINNSGQIVGTGRHGGLVRGFLLNPPRTLVLRDQNGDSIANATVSISRMANDPPAYTARWTEEHTSNEKGEVLLLSDSLRPGDSIRVSLLVKAEPSYKPSPWLATLYTISLDNMVIGDDSRPGFPGLREGRQEVILGHTTIAWNLLVSIEWDARSDYFATLQTGFRGMANYLYDVSNGQMRLDTVVIVDEKLNWQEADFRIYADNTVHPNADRLAGVYHADKAVNMPRKWYGGPTRGRNDSFSEDPLDMSDSVSYTTFCHEYGHYAFGFHDEYQFLVAGTWVSGWVYRCGTVPNYGFMDGPYPYPSYGPYRSEMSTADRYTDLPCRNTAQWHSRGMSCWDWLQTQFQRSYGSTRVFVPIVRPADRVLPSGLDYLPGPNDVLNSPDYDVGAQVVFPAPVSPPSAGTIALLLTYSVTGSPLPDVGVSVKRWPLGAEIYQGNTSDSGKIRLLGVDSNDEVLSWGLLTVTPLSAARRSAPVKAWFSASAIIGDSGRSAYGNVYRSSASADSVAMAVTAISESVRFVAGAGIDFAGVDLRLAMAQPLPSLPSVDVSDSVGVPTTYTFTQVGDRYETFISDPFPATGRWWLHAVDDSARPFFAPLDYRIYALDSAVTTGFHWASGGRAGVRLDSASRGPGLMLLVTSSFPVPRNGLDASALQAGAALTVAVSTGTSLPGSQTLLIGFDDEDLSEGAGAFEENLELWRFDETAQQWEPVGGTVDTSRNEVSAAISEAGIYGAFTSSTPTGLEDGDYITPASFAVVRNYPNPFNPTTTIEYKVPSPIRVRLEVFNVLGRRVRTLVHSTQAAGTHRVEWNGTDDKGGPLPGGVYFYRFQAGDRVVTGKMLLLK